MIFTTTINSFRKKINPIIVLKIYMITICFFM